MITPHSIYIEKAKTNVSIVPVFLEKQKQKTYLFVPIARFTFVANAQVYIGEIVMF